MMAPGSNARFYIALGLIGGLYLALIVAMLVADSLYTSPENLWGALQSEDIRYAIKLSLLSSLVTTILSVWIAVPFGYLLSRTQFWGRPVVETVLDIPIALPPIVIGISLLILFQTAPGKWVEDVTARRMGLMLTYFVVPALAAVAVWPVVGKRSKLLALLAVASIAAGGLYVSGLGATLEKPLQARFGTRITFQIPGVILAQFAVSCAFAVRTMRVTFGQISPRAERVALTLGCTRWQAFWMIAVPESWRGMVSTATLAWARALGEFGPILIFAGATRRKTEVLSTTVFLEFSVGRLDAAIAVSLLMVAIAVLVLLTMRSFGLRSGTA